MIRAAMDRFPLGLALSGGAARGFAHLGVLRALRDRGLRPDRIAGTSAGALVGALWSAGWSETEIREAAAGFAPFQPWRYSFSRPGLLDFRYFRHYWSRFLPDHFEDLDPPLVVVTTDLETGEPAYFESGPLEPAVSASCAIPPFFEAIQIGERWYFDGSLAMNLPTVPLRASCQVVLASECNPHQPADPERHRTTWTQFSRSQEIVFRAQSPFHRSHADLIIEPYGLQDISPFDSYHMEEIEELGYRETLSVLDGAPEALEAVPRVEPGQANPPTRRPTQMTGPKLRTPVFPSLPDPRTLRENKGTVLLALGVAGAIGLTFWWTRRR